MARDVGRLIAEQGWTLATGGYGGVMEAASRGAAETGGRVHGVLVEALGIQGNAWLTERVVMPDLFSRVRALVEKSDAYLVMPGSTGTLLELALVWELLNKGIVRGRPLICLGDFWRPVVEHLAREPLKDPRIDLDASLQTAGDTVSFCDDPVAAVSHIRQTWGESTT